MEWKMEMPSSISRQVPLHVAPIIDYIPARGRVSVAFEITNTTTIPAINPFIALPMLGHLFKSDEDWSEDLIRSNTGRWHSEVMAH
jgi:hypothetical protein